MKKMAAPLLVLILLSPAVSAAPAPDRAKEKLEAMKKKLPEVAQKWIKRWNPFHDQVEVKLVRQISPTKAKVTILLPYLDQAGAPQPSGDEMVTVYLRFYDGTWTSTGYQASWTRMDVKESAVHKLMLGIDELGEK
jgi:hypothetical protein